MIEKNHKLLFIILLSGMFFTACQKQNIQVENLVTSNPYKEYGLIHNDLVKNVIKNKSNSLEEAYEIIINDMIDNYGVSEDELPNFYEIEIYLKKYKDKTFNEIRIDLLSENIITTKQSSSMQEIDNQLITYSFEVIFDTQLENLETTYLVDTIENEMELKATAIADYSEDLWMNYLESKVAPEDIVGADIAGGIIGFFMFGGWGTVVCAAIFSVAEYFENQE